MSHGVRAVAVAALCVSLAACGLRPGSDEEPAALPALPGGTPPSEALPATPSTTTSAAPSAAPPSPSRTSATAGSSPAATPSPARGAPTTAPLPPDPPPACPGGGPSRSGPLQRSAQAARAVADPGVVWVLAYGVRDTGPSPDRPGLHRYALGSPETLTAGGPPAPRFVDGSPRFALDGLTQLSPFAHLVVDREDPTLLRRAVEVQQHLTARFLLDCDGELTGVLQAYARDRLRLDGAVVASIARDPAGPTARDLVAHASPRLPSFEELPPLQRAIPELPMGIVADLGLRQVTLDVPRGWPEQALLASRSPRAWLDLLGLGGQSREITLRHERGQPLELWLAEVEPPRDAFHAPYGRVLSLTAEQLAGTQPLRLRVRPALSSYAAFQACARTGGPCVEVV